MQHKVEHNGNNKTDIYDLVHNLSELCNERNIIHTNKTAKLEEVSLSIATTQETISNTQQCMSESISVITKFIKKYEPHLELIEKVIQTLSSIKTAIAWLAAIIGSMTVIIVAAAVVWLYMTTPIHIQDFIIK